MSNLDTRAKQQAAISIATPWNILLPTPNTQFDDRDRQQLAFCYDTSPRSISSIKSLSGLRFSRAKFPAH